MPLLAVYNPVAASSVDISSIIDGTYPKYEIDYQLVPAVTNAVLIMRTDTGGADTGDSGASDYVYHYVNSATTSHLSFEVADSSFRLSRNTGGGGAVQTTYGISGRICIDDLGSGTRNPRFQNRSSYRNSSAQESWVDTKGRRDAAHEIDFAQLLFTNGNIASGIVLVRGVPGSL